VKKALERFQHTLDAEKDGGGKAFLMSWGKVGLVRLFLQGMWVSLWAYRQLKFRVMWPQDRAVSLA